MRKPTPNRGLSRLIWRERLKTLLPVAGIAAALFGIFAYIYWPDPVVAERRLEAVVEHWSRPQSDDGIKRAIITAVLEDGRTVRARAENSGAPPVGEKIELVERQYSSGRVIYIWNYSGSPFSP